MRSCNSGSQSRRTVFWNDDAMCPCKVGCPDNRPKIVGIFDIVQQNNKRRLISGTRRRKNIFHICIFVSCHVSDDTLMLPCLTQLVEPLFWHKLYHGVMFFCFSLDGLYRPVLRTIQYEKLVNRLSCAKSLCHSIPALYHKFFVSHVNCSTFVLSHYM